MPADSWHRASPWMQLASDLVSLRGDALIARHDLDSSALQWYSSPAIASVAKYLDVALQALDSACVIMARPDVHASAPPAAS